jgi:nucleotide-binding universal stress UspA family protein
VEDRDLAFGAVVFGTDFTESSRAAGRYAALFARHYSAELIVVHGFTLVQSALEVEALRHVRSAQRNDLERLLSETLQELTPVAGRAVSVLDEGRPIDVIRGASERHAESLVVLGTHGGGALERHAIGSVAEEILRTIQNPVLTVGPHVAAPSSDRLAFGQILFATDFSPAAAHAARYAIALARAFRSEIDILHVASGDAAEQSDPTEKEHEFLLALDRIVSEDGREMLKSRSFVEFGKVRERVLEHASDRHADLIVLGAHHHSMLARHLRTGPAFQIIVAAGCPILTICGP